MKPQAKENLKRGEDNLEILSTDDRFSVLQKSEYHWHIIHNDTQKKFNYWPTSNKFQKQQDKRNPKTEVKTMDFNSMVNDILKECGE